MLIPINHAIQFLIQTFFELYIFFILLRVVFHWVKVSANNPILVTIARITHPPLQPIYQILPSINGIDLASIVLLLTFTMLKISLLLWLQTGLIPPINGLAILAFAEILRQLIDIFFYTLLILTLMSWFKPLTLGPIVEIIIKTCDPLLRPARLLLPPFSGLDFSPMLVIVMLRLVMILIVTPLNQIGLHMMRIGLG